MTAAAYQFDFKNFVVVAVVIVFLAALAYRLLNKDDRIRKTRFGFFVERDRYPDEDEPEPEDEDTMRQWPKRDDP